MYPGQVAVINRVWYDKWKERVNYGKFEAQKSGVGIKKSLRVNGGISNGFVTSQTESEPVKSSFFGNWKQSNNLTLGDKIKAEQDFNDRKKAEKIGEKHVEDKAEEKKKE